MHQSCNLKSLRLGHGRSCTVSSEEGEGMRSVGLQVERSCTLEGTVLH